MPTESGAYQDAAIGKELEQLVEALPFCETVEDLANVIEGCAIEVVEDAIAMQDTQPRRQRLTKWLEEAKTEPLLGRDAMTKSWGDTETFQKEIETPTEMEPLKRTGEFNKMTRRRGDTGTRSGMWPNWSVQAFCAQGSESPTKICDLVTFDWWRVQSPTISSSPRLPLSASPRLFVNLLDVQSPDAPVGTHHAPRQSVTASERHLVEPVVPRLKVGDALERLSGGSIGKVAQVLQVFRDWLNTSLGAVTLDEIKSGSWRIIGST